MKDLIKRLEEATEGAFELGAEVLCRIRGVRFLSVEPRATMSNPYHMAVCAEGLGPHDRFEFYANDPTQCMNAAMTLVPEGHSWAGGSCGEEQIPWACVTQNDGRCLDFDVGHVEEAIALTIASLKARENSHD